MLRVRLWLLVVRRVVEVCHAVVVVCVAGVVVLARRVRRVVVRSTACGSIDGLGGAATAADDQSDYPTKHQTRDDDDHNHEGLQCCADFALVVFQVVADVACGALQVAGICRFWLANLAVVRTLDAACR